MLRNTLLVRGRQLECVPRWGPRSIDFCLKPTHPYVCPYISVPLSKPNNVEQQQHHPFPPADPAVKPYARHYAVCLETQHFPDAVNRKEWAESVLLQPGATYLERSRHVFTVDGGGA